MKSGSIVFATFLIIFGITLVWVMAMAPSALLLEIGSHFNITNDVVLNMVVNLPFLFVLTGCLVGPKIERTLGTWKFYILALALVIIASCIIACSTSSYVLLLFGRAIFGLGLGFCFPFFGAAVMKWYSPHGRERMDTVNGLFSFIGPFICFLATAPIYEALGNKWNLALAIWSIPLVVTLILWGCFIKENKLYVYCQEEEQKEKGVYKNLFKRKEMKLLMLACTCDYSCYSFVATVLPMLLVEAVGMTMAEANSVAAFAFPAAGMIGILVAGVVLAKIGLRKPLLFGGQLLEVVGLLLAAAGVHFSPVLLIVGIVIFSFGNAMWTPALFVVPMDLPDMNPARAGAAFSLIGIAGEGFSFIAPVIGGALTGLFLGMTGIADPVLSHATALSWCLIVFGCFNVLGVVCTFLIRETGKRR